MKALLLIPCIIAPAYGEDEVAKAIRGMMVIIAPAYGEDAGYERIKELLNWSPLYWAPDRNKELKAKVINLLPDSNGKRRVSKAEEAKIINWLIPEREMREILDICRNNPQAKEKIRQHIEDKMYMLFFTDPVIKQGGASRTITEKLIPERL